MGGLIFFVVMVFFLGVAFALKRHLLFLFMLWFGHFWMALSSAYLEGGVYITEQQRYSFYNGATFWLLILDAFLWTGIWCSISFLSKFKGLASVRFGKLGVQFVLLFVGVALLLLFLNLVLTGSPMFDSELTRFNYWDNSRLPFLNKILGDVAAPLLVMLGVVFAICKFEGRVWYSKLSLFFFCLFVLYYFLIGHKFSMQLLAFSMFLPPFLFVRLVGGGGLGFKFRHVVGAVFGLFFLFCFIVWNYLEKHSGFVEGQGGAVNAVLYRFFGLQGHVWWGGFNEFLDSAREAGTDPVQSMFNGMQTMMYVVSPPALVDNYLAAGVRFTMAYPAIILYTFGMLGAILFQAFAGLAIGLLVVLCERQLLAGRLIGSIFSLLILNNLIIVFNMGDFSALLSVKFFLPCVALFILMFLSVGMVAGKGKI